jgi:hypothetical protein
MSPLSNFMHPFNVWRDKKIVLYLMILSASLTLDIMPAKPETLDA